jgi:superfamily II helicase
MKVCKKCLKQKDISQFYKHAGMRDGCLNHCIDCVKDRVKKHRSINIDEIRAYDRLRARTAERLKVNRLRSRLVRKQKRPCLKSWAKKNKHKTMAHLKVKRAIEKGLLSKKPCEVCGNQIAEAHHRDYSKPLNVQWLCRQHHAEIHRKYQEAA